LQEFFLYFFKFVQCTQDEKQEQIPQKTACIERHDFQLNTLILALKISKDRRGKRVASRVKIGNISANFQSKTLIPKSKNQIFQKNFICLSDIGLRKSVTENLDLFSTQTRR